MHIRAIEDLVQIMGWKPDEKWYLIGYDTFSCEWYPLLNDNMSVVAFDTEGEARKAAQKQLEELERSQPTSASGGQDGIQDRVYIVHPNGFLERVFPQRRL